MVPGYHKSWHIGVRIATSQQLVAAISGIPMTVRVRDQYVCHVLKLSNTKA